MQTWITQALSGCRESANLIHPVNLFLLLIAIAIWIIVHKTRFNLKHFAIVRMSSFDHFSGFSFARRGVKYICASN